MASDGVAQNVGAKAAIKMNTAFFSMRCLLMLTGIEIRVFLGVRSFQASKMLATEIESFFLQALFRIFRNIATSSHSCRKFLGAKRNSVDALLAPVLPRILAPANILRMVTYLVAQPARVHERIKRRASSALILPS
jgi:hypothetical protein